MRRRIGRDRLEPAADAAGEVAFGERFHQLIGTQLRRRVERVARREEGHLPRARPDLVRLHRDDARGVRCVLRRRVEREQPDRVLDRELAAEAERDLRGAADDEEVEGHARRIDVAGGDAVSSEPAPSRFARDVVEFLETAASVTWRLRACEQRGERGLHLRVLVGREHDAPAGLREVQGIDVERQAEMVARRGGGLRRRRRAGRRRPPGREPARRSSSGSIGGSRYPPVVASMPFA